MTAPTEKGAPIPAEVANLAIEHTPKFVDLEWPQYEAVRLAIARAILADREARPSLPDSRGEREPQTFNDIIAAHQSLYDEWLACAVDDAADRARARQGGNNG